MNRNDYNFQININVDARAFKIIKNKLDEYQKEFADIDNLKVGQDITILAGFNNWDSVRIESINYEIGMIKGLSSITNTIMEFNLLDSDWRTIR